MNEKKIILIGSSKSGKTSLINKLLNNEFNENLEETIGAKTQIFEYENYLINFWDISGNPQSKSLLSLYLPNSDGIIFFVDITNSNSLKEIIEKYETCINICPKSFKLLISSKEDLENFRKINKEEIIQFAEDHDMELINISNKNNINLDLIFPYIIKNIPKGNKIQVESKKTSFFTQFINYFK